MITSKSLIAPYKPSHPAEPAPYLSAPTRPVIWCVYTAAMFPSPVPNATLPEIANSALLNNKDTGTAVGLLRFLFTSRNF